VNIAYLDPAYSGHFHALASSLAAKTGGAALALLSSPAYRAYVGDHRAIVWQPGRSTQLREPPHDFDHATWAPTHDVRSWQVFSHAVDWFVARFREERIELCMIFSDARPFSVAARLAAEECGVVCLYFERGAFRFSTSSLSTLGLNGRFSLARAQALPRLVGVTGTSGGERPLRRRPVEPWLRTRFARFVLQQALACLLERDRLRMQHKWYSISHYVRLALNQWWQEHHHRRDDPAEVAALAGRRVVIVPLQLPGDSQLVLYSPFPDNQAFIDFVITHVRETAPDAVLLFKRHPMDASRYRLPPGARWIGGNLARFDAVQPVTVCINSNVGFEALVRGQRVVCFARSFYADAPSLVMATPSDFVARLREVLAREGDAAAGAALRAAVLRCCQAPGDTWAYTPKDIEETAEVALQHYRAARVVLAPARDVADAADAADAAEQGAAAAGSGVPSR
jgi:capsular polysaccharide export protein